VIFGLAVPAATGFFPAPMDFVDGGPCPPLGLFLGHAAFLVALFYVLGLALLFVRVFGFITAWHFALLKDGLSVVQMVYRCRTIAAIEWQYADRRSIF
jgi:hypothetical protein